LRSSFPTLVSGTESTMFTSRGVLVRREPPAGESVISAGVAWLPGSSDTKATISSPSRCCPAG